MRIGIDASRAFQKKRTGIEEYSYQLIKYLRDKLQDAQVVLYVKRNFEFRSPAGGLEFKFVAQEIDFELPESWKIKPLFCPRLWTQLRLSLELLVSPVDVLFIPAHTVPIVHPKNTIVTIHGLEHEICADAYSSWERIYMSFIMRKSCHWSKKIICVSENSKKDLMRLYRVIDEKIRVIYEGFYVKQENPSSSVGEEKLETKTSEKYFLFLGRLEERKNIIGIIEAFEILKQKYNLPHKLILAGGTGYKYEKIKHKIQGAKVKDEIIQMGFVGSEKKAELLKNADVFLFPTFYEGFGLPILEAQSVNVPVVASNNSSVPEVAGEGAILVDPNSSKEIAAAAYKLISDKETRGAIIEKGRRNLEKFSWEKCAVKTSELLKS